MSDRDRAATALRAVAWDCPPTVARRNTASGIGRMMLRLLLFLGVFAALAAVSGRTADDAYACHPDRLSETRINLDADRAKEEVVAADSHDCAHTTFKAYVHVRDRCRGAWRTYDLGNEAHTLQRFRIANADGRTKRPEVFFVTRRLGLVAAGIAAVVRLDDRVSGCYDRTCDRYIRYG